MDTSILVIDDERDFLESLARGLKISGYSNLRLVLDPMRRHDWLKTEKLTKSP
jgi:ActR/RegA family two-component response regulator